jgi:hypothetical protein
MDVDNFVAWNMEDCFTLLSFPEVVERIPINLLSNAIPILTNSGIMGKIQESGNLVKDFTHGKDLIFL